MHDTSLADIRVAQHQDLVRRCEIQRHVCRGSRAVLNCCWVDNRVVGRGLFFADGRRMGDERSIRGLRFSPPMAGVEDGLTIACDFLSLMRGFYVRRERNVEMHVADVWGCVRIEDEAEDRRRYDGVYREQYTTLQLYMYNTCNIQENARRCFCYFYVSLSLVRVSFSCIIKPCASCGIIRPATQEFDDLSEGFACMGM